MDFPFAPEYLECSPLAVAENDLIATGGAQNVTVAVKIAAATQYTARRQSTLQA
jgi:hypothetical protein